MTVAAVALALALLLNPAAAVRRSRVVGPVLRPSERGPRADDPLATASSLDVLAVCLSAGMSVAAAARATAASAPPELAGLLGRAADLIALGADPGTAWAATAEVTDEHCIAFLRLARRSAVSGAALAQGVTELAEQSRQAAVHRAEATAERAAVVIAGPLGLCFLPAFVCLGVVPVVAGLAAEVLGPGLL
ncbi:type II secretion system F family protein [[Mycobacterium] burgundiense]|uniref:Type II secretion system F family protein n=1 Tax=[Mycobacterium] burgundiense TaxID=3064286 RepID=A0ABN9MU63_9MYCO|nr:type II secretion system F family protein [Mycolicibacterium sp. MU0053]CAJ1495216.1 type II secretion system F family protein [Mycolicibacterium sp. MU0053]